MTFKGGYTFKNFEGRAEPVLKELPVPASVFLPFEHQGRPFSSLVNEGDRVRAGEKILESGDPVCSIPSPVSGTVSMVDGGGITVTSDGTVGFTGVAGQTKTPWEIDRTGLFDLLCTTGALLLLDSSCVSADACGAVNHIIIDALHNSPLNQAWSPDTTDPDNLFADGVKTVKALFSNASIVLAANKRTSGHFRKQGIQEFADVRILSDKYPQENPGILSRDIAGKRLIAPDGTVDRSILVVPYQNIVRLAEVLVSGRPLIDRIVMVAGPGVSKPGWYRIRNGTPFGELESRLLNSYGDERWRMVKGDLMTGESTPDGDVSVSLYDKDISVIREGDIRELWRFMRPGFSYDSYPNIMASELTPFVAKALDSNLHGGVRPCVQCNYCDEVCPVDLYPHLIMKIVESREGIEETFRLRPYDCVGCGLCDYVCPSKISLVASVQKAKDDYIHSRRSDDGNN